MKQVQQAAEAVLQQLETVIYGKRPILELVLTCLFAEGHLLLRLAIGYPSLAAEEQMLVRSAGDPLEKVVPVLSLEALAELQDQVREVHVHPEVRRYLVAVITSTRNARELVLGAGPRATQ